MSVRESPCGPGLSIGFSKLNQLFRKQLVVQVIMKQLTTVRAKKSGEKL